MQTSAFVMLTLTCSSREEADAIARRLLEKKLIACAKSMPVDALFSWQGAIEGSQEILLVMESLLDHFECIEEEIATLHSYNTFVLMAIPLVKVSARARVWIQESVE